MHDMNKVTLEDYRYGATLARMEEIQREIDEWRQSDQPRTRDQILKMRALRREWRQKNEWIKKFEEQK